MAPKIPFLTVLLAMPSLSFSAIIVSDPFDDGGFTDGADASDTGWFKNTTDSAISVVNDVAMGGNALNFNTNPAFRATTAAIPTSTLVNNGDFIKLSFSFRYTATPANVVGGIRFGIYNNPVALADTGDDVSPGSGNTATGYYVNFTSGTTASTATAFAGHEIIRESGTVSGILGGTDRTSLGLPPASGLGVTDTSVHTASLLITKTATGYTLVGQLDGNSLANGTTTTTLYNGFNTIGISTAGNESDLLIDNVVVDFVPEPSSAILAGAGALAFALRRRRR